MPHNNLYYEFGPYLFNLSERVLKRAGETISLTPKAAEILFILVTKAGQLVEKDELLKEVWPDTFVEESNLSQNIFYLRKALGDDRAGPRYIETVPRRGYRFIATVKVVEAGENHRSNGFHVPQEPGANGQPVVAVLPFINVLGDPEVEYLVQGITDNVINNLSRISKLRVMSRSAVFRYRTKEIDPQQAGRDLGAQVVLVGKISSRPDHQVIDVELVDTSTGWLLWGESFDSGKKDLLEIQEAITRQIVALLKLKLSGDEEKRITARYTENAEAYQSYLEGRHHWSKYTRAGIERAIGHFRNAIELDPNYALAYAGIIDCYLRLATNYLPPEDDVLATDNEAGYQPETSADDSDPRVKLRFEWDWKGAERELRRANELQTTYPTAPQWYAAYATTRQLYDENTFSHGDQSKFNIESSQTKPPSAQIASLQLTTSEQIQIYCTISREQIDAGNYDAASKILRPWWLFGSWPKLDGLNQRSSADLLFTAGELAGFVASTQQIPRGQRHGEELLIGSITLFEHLGLRRQATEGRIELALCYYRQGLFDIGRSNLMYVLDELSEDDWELRSLALIRLASLERHAGRLRDALGRLIDATDIVKLSGPWATGRRHLELASTYKDLAIAEEDLAYFNNAKQFYYKALHEFEAIGNHRYVAIVENNIGFLLLNLNAFNESECHLLRSRRLFEAFSDVVRGAQVNETLARLYVATQRYVLAQDAITKSVQILERTDGEALLAEALTTNGLVESKLANYSKAKSMLQAGCSVAERCGDYEGAGRALLILLEELNHQLEWAEKLHISEKLKGFFETTQQTATQTRLQKCIEKLRS
jgi:DNA-binding winged helix-turn-helix (wHTH) protein